MATLRGRLSAIACAWLCCQLSILTAAPASLLSGMPHASDSVTCTCGHAGATECPMHHSKPKKEGCECRSTTDPDAAAMLSLLGPIAILAEPPCQAVPVHITKSPDRHITTSTSTIAPPTPPPPRA